MDIPFQNCIVSPGGFSVPLIRELLECRHGLACILLDLQKLDGEMLPAGKQHNVNRYLSSREQDHLGRFASDKRQREWLGGRFAARHAAAVLLARTEKDLPWPSLAVLADENGRPFLAADKKNGALPDISISHSGNLAAAMAVSAGLCGIDIQKVGPRVVKVRDRFCSAGEERIIQSHFSAAREKQSAVLTRLWAAKEALRKVANTRSLPGFLELELTEIIGGTAPNDPASWRFVFMWKHSDINGKPRAEKCFVAVSLIADYALALTTRNDIVA